MEDLQDKIIELMDLFDDEEVTTADKIERPQRALDREAIDDFMKRNPQADGGMLVKPGFGGTRQGYAKSKKKVAANLPDKYGKFTGEGLKGMERVSDAILKAYADDDITYLFEKKEKNPRGLISAEDSKQGLFKRIKEDQSRIDFVVKNTGLDEDTIFDILDDRIAYLELEKERPTKPLTDKKIFLNKAEKWLMTNSKRYADPAKFEKAFIRTFGKNNLITKTIKANITDVRGKGRLGGFSDDFIKTIMATSQGVDPTKTSIAFDSRQLKEMFKTVIYNNNPNVRKRITKIFENIIPEPGSKRTPDVRKLFENDPVLKKFGLDKSIKGPIARLILNEIGEDLFTNVRNFQKPFLGTDALLNYLKDRVDPKYKEMFREASNAVKQAQKNQWPQAKKSLNLSQSIMFDHKIPKSIIEKGYADEIEYIKLNPTSEKFNATIKRSQFDQPLLNLIDEFERSKTLDAKANVVTKMNKLKNDFSKKYGGYLDEISINVDKTGKPIFTSAASPVTKKTDLVSSLGKSMTQTGEISKKQLDNLLLKLSGQIDPDCAGAIKQASKDGGRIGLKTVGSPAFCKTKARNYMSQELINGIGTQQNAKTSLIKRIIAGSANFLKQNLSPKELLKMENLIGKPALYGAAAFETGLVADDVFRKGKPLNVAAAESLFGTVLNLDANVASAKNLLESNVQLSPAAKEYAQNIIDYDRYRKNELSFPSSLIAKSMPGSDRYFKMQEDLKNKIMTTPDTGALDYQSSLTESEAIFKAKPKTINVLGKDITIDAPDAPEVTPLTNKFAQPPGTRVGPMTAKQDMKIDLTPITYKNFQPNIPSKEELEEGLRNIGMIGQDEIITDEAYQQKFYKPEEFSQLFQLPSFTGANQRFAKGGRAGYGLGRLVKLRKSKVREEGKATIDDSLKMFDEMKKTGEIDEISSDLDKLIKKALDEDLFDKKDAIVDTLNAKIARERKNFPYNQQVFEEPSQLDFYDAITKSNFRTKKGPFFDYQKRKNKAGGGLLKQAGDRSGPPPESGPNPQGLQGLLNRVKKV